MDNSIIYNLQPGDLITNDGDVLEFIKVLTFRRNRPEKLEFRHIFTKEILPIYKWNLTCNWRKVEYDHPQYKAIKVLYGKI